MFTEQDLNGLVAFRSDSSPVLSLYLNVDPTQQTKDHYRLTLRSLLKEVGGEADAKDVEAMERYFEHEYDWQGRGVALFSCHAVGFWQAFVLAVPVHNHAYVSHRPYILSLIHI